MSSSNLVRLTYIEEVIMGETPVAGDFNTARFTSEGLSGTAETTESQQIRSDRLSSGQVVVGLTVGGDLAFEAAKEKPLDDFMEGAMLNRWVVTAAVIVDIEIDVVAKTLTRSAGSWAGLPLGSFLTLAGFVEVDSAGKEVNNVQVMAAEIVSPTVLRFTGPDDMIDEVGPAGLTSYKIADHLTIGTEQISFSMEKAFLDLTAKAINYRGMMVGAMSLSVAYGDIVTGSFTFSGTDYEPVATAAEFMTFGRTIVAAPTSQSLNGSVDMPFLSSSAVGQLDDVAFCIQSVEITLENNLTPQNCIGLIAPKSYSPGTAAISISLSAYLSDDNWAILAKKQSQAAFALAFQIKNADGWYGFYLPALQVSFEDPNSGGANADVVLDMSGTAKVGAAGDSSLRIYRGV